MIDTIIFFAIFNLAIIIYIYIGYPMLLFLVSVIRPRKPIKKEKIRPSVSLLISSYNEEAVIRDKLENSLKLDYPDDLLEILVISDCSSDRTDEIVRQYANRGVQLIRQNERLGKTLGLNKAIPQANGEIIVFSDANAMYYSDAISHLVENFADKKVGYVVGESKYSDTDESPASDSENTYWNYEIKLKKIESQIHSIVGGDGAIYAIRKPLYRQLQSTDINDFVNPLQIIVAGYRGIYEPKAICYENASGKFRKEFKRKTRIVNRSFSGLLRVKSAMNPFRTGLFSFQLISHKLLRWLASFFMINFFISTLILSFQDITVFQVLVLIQILSVGLAYLGYLLKDVSNLPRLIYFAYYFVGVNVAALHGVLQSLSGSVQATWEPQRSDRIVKPEGRFFNFAIHGIIIALTICFIYTLNSLFNIDYFLWKSVFWFTFSILIYTYWGYPLVVYIWGLIAPKPITKGEIKPSVTMLICAYNEEAVIEQKIHNCLALDYPFDKLKIVIASDGSNDKTVEIVNRVADDRVTVFDYPKRCGKVCVINKTLPHLSGEIIFFSDANTMLDSGSVKKLLRNFYDPKVGAVSADVIIKNNKTTYGYGESLYHRYERFIQERESLVHSIIGADGGMYAIRRELFIAPPNNTIIDDFVISMNVAVKGLRLVYDKTAIGYEGNVNTSSEEFLRMSRVIAGAVQVLKSRQGIPSFKQVKLFFCFVSHKLLRWMSSLFLMALLIVNFRLYIADQSIAYTLILVMQLFFIIAAFAGLLLKEKKLHPLFIIPFYFYLLNTASLFGIYKGLLDKQSVIWKKFDRINIDFK